MLNPWLIFVVILVTGATYLGIELRCPGTTDCPATLQQALRDGLTLAGISVGLLCAAAAIWIVHWQSNEGLRAARARRAKISRALRAEMPEHLRRLETYAKECIRICTRVIDEAKAEREREENAELPFGRNRLTCPSLYPRTLVRLHQPAEDLEPSLAEQVAELLGCYEAQRTRIEHLVQTYNEPMLTGVPAIEEHHAELPLRSTIELYLRSTRLFPFASRRQSEAVEPLEMDYATVNLALIQLGIFERLSPYGRERLLARFGVETECRRMLLAPTTRKRTPAAITWFFTR
jgi:hypothetical protein